MKRLIAPAALVLGLALAAAPALAQKAPPVDEAARDPALVKVRAALIEAVKKRDARALSLHLHPNLRVSFGAANGRALFLRNLARDPGLWDELAWVLENGGQFAQGTFAAPYTFSVDHGDIDTFEAGIVVAENVPARAEPKPDAAIVATYSREVVAVKKWWPQSFEDGKPKPVFHKRTDWVEIETKEKAKAYMEARHVRSVVDYRAIFERRGGVWRVTAFVAGD